MVESESVVKKWGNSLGLIIPKSVVDKENLQENETILIEIKKKHKAKDFFGLITNWKVSTDNLKREMKKGWE